MHFKSRGKRPRGKMFEGGNVCGWQAQVGKCPAPFQQKPRYHECAVVISPRHSVRCLVAMNAYKRFSVISKQKRT